MLYFLTGGARSGKSTLALRLAAGAAANPGGVTFVATAEAGDDEMRGRIERHRRERPPSWQTQLAPRELVTAVAAIRTDHVAVIDCLSLWVSNRLLDGATGRAIERDATEVVAQLRNRDAASIVVTNEVGLGIVPVNDLARHYREVLGRVNQLVAAASDRALFCAAGRVLELSSVEELGLPLGRLSAGR